MLSFKDLMKKQLTPLSQKLRDLGIHSSVNSVDGLVDQWATLTEQQRVEGYRLLSEAEERVETAEYSVREYSRRRDHHFVSSLRNFLINVVPDPSIFDGGPEGDSGLCHVAECKDKVVGYVRYDEDVRYCHIHEVVVAPRFRGRGIMSGLIGSIEGNVPLSLLVHSSNQVARGAFSKFGFVQEGSTPDGYLFLVKEF